MDEQERTEEAMKAAEADAKLEAKRARMAVARAAKAASAAGATPARPKLHHNWQADDPECTICVHPDRDKLEQIFMSFQLKSRQLAHLAETGVEAWEKHVRALGLVTQRANETNNVRAYIVGKAFEEGALDAPKLSDILALLAQIDKANGVGQPQLIDQRPVIIIGVPEPGGRTAPVDITIQGKVVNAIPTVPMTVPKAPKEVKEK